MDEILNLLTNALKICKEKELEKLEIKLDLSYIELINIESMSRKDKASSNIRSIQLLDKEIFFLNREYKKVVKKFDIEAISAIDDYIREVKKYRLKLVSDKNSLK